MTDEFVPIATREYRQGDTPVFLTFGKPYLNPDEAGEYRCPVHVDGLASGSLDVWAAGVDDVQAIILAIKMAGALLDREGLTFLGHPDLALDAS